MKAPQRAVSALAGLGFVLSAAAEYPVAIEKGLVYSTPSATSHVYRLVGRSSPFEDTWYPVSDAIPGTGGSIRGFERGTNDVFLPSRAWEISRLSDGWSLAFDGVDDFAYAAHSPELNLTGAMTLEAWLKPGATGTEATLIAKAISESITCYSLDRDAGGHIRFRLHGDSGGVFVDLSSSAPVPAGSWVHVAATYDGTVAQLFLDGVQDAAQAASATVRTSALSPLGIGSILGTRPLAGYIDEVRIWNYALGPIEILGAYLGDIPPAAPGIVGYWPLSEAGGQLAVDSGPHGLDLLLGDTDQPDATDPSWTHESCSGATRYQMIWTFGEPTTAIHWDSQAGATYTVLAKDQLGQPVWTPLGPTLPGTGHPLEFFDSRELPMGFYRILAEGYVPEGLYFAGYLWEGFRTDFEVGEGALSSIPAPVEGFNYGHWGNGRGPIAVTHVGDTTWTDYSLELDIEFLPPNPTWNPYAIPPCYRAGGVHFRAASLTESWNDPAGLTHYALTLAAGTCDDYQKGDWKLLRFHDFYMPGTGWSPGSVGTRHELATGNSPAIHTGSNHVRIDAIGDTILIWINHTLILDYQDSTAPGGPVLYGGVGFVSNFESMVTVTNLAVNHLEE